MLIQGQKVFKKVFLQTQTDGQELTEISLTRSLFRYKFSARARLLESLLMLTWD